MEGKIWAVFAGWARVIDRFDWQGLVQHGAPMLTLGVINIQVLSKGAFTWEVIKGRIPPRCPVFVETYNCEEFTIKKDSTAVKILRLKINLQLQRIALGQDKEFSMKCIENNLTMRVP
jgi:hypothetical protein